MLHLAQSSQPNPLVPSWPELISGLIAFFVVFGLLAKLLMPRIQKTLEERTDAIEGGLKRAEDAQAEAAKVLDQYRAQLAEARHEAARLRQDATEQGAQIIAEMKQQGQAEYARLTAAAQAQIEAEVLPFIDDMAKTYAWADLAVCRAGAMTVAELQAAGLGAIFVPLPIATDDHQTKNAAVMVGVGAARVIQERDLTPEALSAIIAALIQDRAHLLKMAEAARGGAIIDAAARLADLCTAAGAHA